MKDSLESLLIKAYEEWHAAHAPVGVLFACLANAVDARMKDELSLRDRYKHGLEQIRRVCSGRIDCAEIRRIAVMALLGLDGDEQVDAG